MCNSYSHKHFNQLRFQDFPIYRRQPFMRSNFPDNCMKIEKNMSRRGDTSEICLCRSATVNIFSGFQIGHISWISQICPIIWIFEFPGSHSRNPKNLVLPPVFLNVMSNQNFLVSCLHLPFQHLRCSTWKSSKLLFWKYADSLPYFTAKITH